MKLLPFLRRLGGLTALCYSLTVIDSAPAASAGDSALYAIGGLSSNDIWAAGYKYQGNLSFPLVEHWDGASWSIIPNPPNVLQSQMHGVAMVAPNDVWIVGQTWNVSDQAYVLHWNGSSLQSVPCVNPGSYVALYAVAAVAANDVWAAGDYSTNGHDYFTLIEHWDGTRWSVGSSPGGTYDTLSGITAVAANDIWAVGGTLDGSEILHWNGQAWSISPTGSIENYASYYSVAAISPNDVWAIGTRGGTLTDHWNGTQWSLISSPNPSRVGNGLFGVAAIAPNDVWAVGQSFASTYRTVAMHWDGAAWKVARTPNPGSGFGSNVLYAACALASNDVWAVGIGQQALTLHWDGRRWRVIPNPG